MFPHSQSHDEQVLCPTTTKTDLIVSTAHGQQSSSKQPCASLATRYAPSSDGLPAGQLHAHIERPHAASIYVVPETDTAVRAAGQ